MAHDTEQATTAPPLMAVITVGIAEATAAAVATIAADLEQSSSNRVLPVKNCKKTGKQPAKESWAIN